MAIKKSKTLNSGVVGEYWKIIDFSYNRLSQKVVCYLALFKDKAASDAGAAPLPLIKPFQFTLSEQEQLDNIVTACYLKIKEQASRVVSQPFSEEPFLLDSDIAGGEDV